MANTKRGFFYKYIYNLYFEEKNDCFKLFEILFFLSFIYFIVFLFNLFKKYKIPNIKKVKMKIKIVPSIKEGILLIS